jgi:hypothetical protein
MEDVTANIDRFLDAHRSGLRDFDDTADNLKKLFSKLETEDQKTFFKYLWTRLARQLHRTVLPITQGRIQQPSLIRAIMRSVADFGPVDFFVQLFAHLDTNNPIIVKNWENDVFPEIILALTNQPDRFPQAILDALKANTALYSNSTRSRLSGIQPTSELGPSASRLEKAIEELEFDRFEKAFAEQAPGDADQPKSTPADHLVLYLRGLDVAPSISAAMVEAQEYLRASGQFDPKKAADLLRSSIDEMNRAIVADLVKLTNKGFSHKQSDGRRRQYMREVGFISLAEETFFSSIYSLISEEATHRLLAPKETVLLLEKTVSGYLILLARRLSEWRGQNLSVSK